MGIKPDHTAMTSDEQVEDFTLPGGTLISNPIDIRYLRYLQERASLNRPEEIEASPAPQDDRVAKLEERVAELEDIVQYQHDRERDLEAKAVNSNYWDHGHPLYSREVQKLLDMLDFCHKEQIVHATAFLVAAEPKWASLKRVPEITGVPLSTIRDWIDAKLIRFHQPDGVGGHVYVYGPDVLVQKELQQRRRRH
jgi:hypothetical protein